MNQTRFRTAAVRQQIIGSRHYSFSYMTGELAELAEAIQLLDWGSAREEFGDCAYAAQQLLSQATGTNLPLLCCRKSVEKFLVRIEVWQKAFDAEGVRFHVDTLKGGSNYAKPAKVAQAFALAGHQLAESDATRISRYCVALEGTKAAV